MYHLLAFFKASAGGVTLEDVPGVQDDWAALNASNHYLLPLDMQLRFAYALNPNLTVAQISTPHFRQVALPAINPLDVGTIPTSLPSIHWFQPPFATIKQNDELTTLQTDTAVGAISKYSLIGLMDRNVMNIPQGDIYTLRGTATITLALSWVTGTFAFDQTLPYGTYAVIGMDVVGNNVVAGRLIFPGGGPRPGCVGRSAQSQKPDQTFRMGRMGEWGRFTTTSPPSVQVFGAAAGASPIQVFLDVVKVA